MPTRPDRPRPRSRRAVLRDRLKGQAYTLLSLLRQPLARPVVVRAANEIAEAEIVLRPAGAATLPAGSLPGRHFSPLEQLIVDAIAGEKARSPDRPLLGKNVASLTRQAYDPKLKAILANLVDRGVLVHDVDGEHGYNLPPGFGAART